MVKMRQSSSWAYEEGGHYVTLEPVGWTVWRPSVSGTHVVSDCAFPATDDGKALAIARVLYLARGPGRWAREATEIAKRSA